MIFQDLFSVNFYYGGELKKSLWNMTLQKSPKVTNLKLESPKVTKGALMAKFRMLRAQQRKERVKREAAAKIAERTARRGKNKNKRRGY